VIKSKFGLLHYTERQKTLFAAQQLRGDANMWWTNYTDARPTDYQVSCAKFCNAFLAHHILASVIRRKYQEFIDLKQSERSVHDYSKLFNHLTHYAPDQVDMDEKKKNCFMNDLSMKLQERLALNTSRSFLEYISNVIITDDAIRAHKENKKRKVVAAPSDSVPPKYWMVYHHPPTYQPRQHQHQRQHQLWVSHSHQHLHQ
jgi:hypothetical protein